MSPTLRSMTEETYETKTMKCSSPDGTVYVQVLEDKSCEPIHVIVTIGKTGAAVRAWSEALAALISTLLRHNVSIFEIIAELSEHTSDKMVRHNGKGGLVKIRSGIEAITYCLHRYNEGRFDEITGSRKTRGARILHIRRSA
jgi:hypothetical protein